MRWVGDINSALLALNACKDTGYEQSHRSRSAWACRSRSVCSGSEYRSRLNPQHNKNAGIADSSIPPSVEAFAPTMLGWWRGGEHTDFSRLRIHAARVETPLSYEPRSVPWSRGCEGRHRSDASHDLQHVADVPVVPKDHPQEREADHVSNEILRTPFRSGVATNQFEPLARAVPPGTRKQESDASFPLSATLGPGVPLSPSVRDFFEPRLGAGLDGVRVHVDSAAARAAFAV